MIYIRLLLISLTVSLLMTGCDGQSGKVTHKITKALTDEVVAQVDKKLKETSQPAQTQVPKGLEIPAKLNDRPEQILSRTGYTVSYNRELRLPNWAAWHLTADHVTGPYKRSGIKFTADDDVPEPRVDTYDYINSRYDRGHMCPSGDNKWSEDAQRDCFLMTNICPQNHNLNAGDWNEMEQQCRSWAEQYGDLYIVCGPLLYKGKHKTIGKHRVTVPEAFFKVALCMQGTPKAIGFIYKNQSGNRPKGDYVNTVDQVERLTGIDFFPQLPDNVESVVESQAELEDW